MHTQLTFAIPIIDPCSEFVHTIENRLQVSLPRDYVAVGYTSREDALRDIRTYPLQTPLVVIADREARTPTIKAGVFFEIREIVPRARGVLFSASPSLDEWRDVLGEEVLYSAIDQLRPTAIQDLRAAVLSAIQKFEQSLEYLILKGFAEQMRTTPHPEQSSVADDDDEFAPVQMLVEMARGTSEGYRYFHGAINAILKHSGETRLGL